MKICNKCDTAKPLDEFYKHAGYAQGVASECRLCSLADRKARYAVDGERIRARNRAWAAANPEKKSASVRAWGVANRERKREMNRAWCAANPERKRAINIAWMTANLEKFQTAARAWRCANRERYRSNTRSWQRKNRDKVRAANAASRIAHPNTARAAWHRRRARHLAAFVENVSLAVLLARDYRICGICDLQIAAEHENKMYRASIDHIIPLAKRGLHSYANTQPAHLLCNVRKGATLPEVA